MPNLCWSKVPSSVHSPVGGVKARKGGNEIDSAGSGYGRGQFFAFLKVGNQIQIVFQPIKSQTGDGYRSFHSIMRLLILPHLIGHGCNQSVFWLHRLERKINKINFKRNFRWWKNHKLTTMPVLYNRNPPVPYVILACPGSRHSWPIKADCWSPRH